MLQNNINIVTNHIRKNWKAKGESDIDRKVLTFLPTKDGKNHIISMATAIGVYVCSSPTAKATKK